MKLQALLTNTTAALTFDREHQLDGVVAYTFSGGWISY